MTPGRKVALILAAGGALGFALITGLVASDATHELDAAILLALRTPGDLADPIGPPWLEAAARDVTSLGSYTVVTLLTAAVILYLAFAGRRSLALLVLAAVGGGIVISVAIKALFDRARPDLVPHAVEVFTASYPSGHAMLSAVTYLTLGALLARAEPRRQVRAFFMGVAVVFTLLVGASRAYLGVHWPTDILAGWCLGAAWAILCWLVARGLERAGAVERPDVPGPAAGSC